MQYKRQEGGQGARCPLSQLSDVCDRDVEQDRDATRACGQTCTPPRQPGSVGYTSAPKWTEKEGWLREIRSRALVDRITDCSHIVETRTESYRFRRTLEKQKSRNPNNHKLPRRPPYRLTAE